MLRGLRVGYVFHRNAADPQVQSGRPASILDGLEQRDDVQVVRIFPLGARQGRWTVVRKVSARLRGRVWRGDREPRYLRDMANEVSGRVDASAADVVFCPGSEAVAALGGRVPVTFCADATFANMVDYYWDYTGLTRNYQRQGHAQERKALSRAALAVYPTQWAAESAVADYGADPGKVAVIPFGANLGQENTESEVRGWIGERDVAGPYRVLFIGRHWERKGGKFVIEAVKTLRRSGLEVSLDVVGCDPPSHARKYPWLRSHGLLRAGRLEEAEHLRALFRRAHFVFVPSRAEAYGMTFAEANAFGVPAVATTTGGIPGVVRDGHNGILLPLEADGRDYAEAIGAVLSERGAYMGMAERAYGEFASRLNWRTFCSEYFRRLQEVMGSSLGRRECRPESEVVIGPLLRGEAL